MFEYWRFTKTLNQKKSYVNHRCYSLTRKRLKWKDCSSCFIGSHIFRILILNKESFKVFSYGQLLHVLPLFQSHANSIWRLKIISKSNCKRVLWPLNYSPTNLLQVIMDNFSKDHTTFCEGTGFCEGTPFCDGIANCIVKILNIYTMLSCTHL